MLIPDEMTIYFYSEPVDMRKSINTLCILVAETLKRNSADGSLYLFCSRGGNKIKALYYETNCFTLCYRRLERGKFIFSRDANGIIEMTREHFNWLLASDKYSLNAANQPQQIENFA